MLLLRNKGFLLLCCGQFLSLQADYVLRTMLLIWVYNLTRSGIAVSMVGLTASLSLLVLAPIAGVCIDRWNRTFIMVGALFARALLLLPLLVVANKSGLLIILLVTLLANGAGQSFQTAASAAVPVVVGHEHAGQGNSLVSIINGSVAVIAPVAASLLFALSGPHSTVVTIFLLYVLAVPLLVFLPAPRLQETRVVRSPFATDMLDGFRYIRHSPVLLSVATVTFVTMLGVGALSVLDVVFVTRGLHLSSNVVGVLFTAMGGGELIGGVITALASKWVAKRHHRLLAWAIIANGCGNLAYAFAPTLLSAAVILFGVGLSVPSFLVSSMTLTQMATDDVYMGRVISMLNTGMAIAMIASMACAGLFADIFGVRYVIGGAATLTTLSGTLALALIRTMPVRQAKGAKTGEGYQVCEQDVSM